MNQMDQYINAYTAVLNERTVDDLNSMHYGASTLEKAIIQQVWMKKKYQK